MSLKLEYGKRYVRRDGKVTGPMKANDEGDSKYQETYPFYDPECYQGYKSNGRYLKDESQCRLDLVSEYVEPQAPSYGPAEVYAAFEEGRFTARPGLDANGE